MLKINKKIILLVVFNFFILMSLITLLNPSWIIAGDGYGYYIYLRSLIFDHDLNFQNEYSQFDAIYGAHMSTNITPLGKVGNMFSVGPSILWAPFVFIAFLIDLFFNFSQNYFLPGFNYPFEIAIAIAAFFYFFIGLVFLYLGLKKLFAEKISFWSTTIIWLTSPLVYYLVYEPSMSHALSFFSVSGFLYFFIKYKNSFDRNNFLIIGFWLGLAMLVRWQNLLFAALPVVWILWQQKIVIKNRLRLLFYFFTSAFVVFSPQLLMWKYLYGSFLVAPQGGKFFDLFNPHFVKFLFSGYHGFFVWHPFLLFSVLGLFFYIKKNKKLAVLFLLTLFLQIYMNSALSDWFGGGSFGARRMISSIFILAIGLTFIMSQLNRKRIALIFFSLIIFLAISWNILLMISCARGVVLVNVPITTKELFSEQKKIFLNIVERKFLNN
ncbi:hypothetical protein HOD96_03365 [Candidatus Falkowbacteria bacterium]|jgi:hypothetical protein|nr:hypothetical protein [Candidatus Falkowbacteria bacterium]MBT4432967.1 hypothetical protein [Candidatus Falkowbacteria bacterium]